MREYTGPHDYFNEEYVREWEQKANTRRPFRIQFFDAFVREVASIPKPKLLDLGAGPGFLAHHILARCDVASYHLFDFSPHMLGLSRKRLEAFEDKVCFHQGSFLDDRWWQSLPTPFDAVVSMQAVHEVRRAERIPQLYSEAGLLLKPGGLLLIADKDEEHLLTAGEHEAALCNAGFGQFRRVLEAGDLTMFAAVLR